MAIYKCKMCGKEFKSYNKNPMCCSQECMTKYKNTPEYKEYLSKVKKSYSKEKQVEILKKQEKTMLEKYGVRHNWCAEASDDINGRGTIKKLYGGIGAGSAIIKEHIEQNNLKKYGKKYWLNPEKFKETYAKKTEEEKEKIRKAKAEGVFKKYGVYSYYQSAEYLNLYKDPEWEARRIARINASKKNNATYNVSKNEKILEKLLRIVFPDLQTQYNSVEYPFNCDFYIPSKQLYVEYNEHWTHGYKPFENTEEDLQRLEKYKEKIESSAYYKMFFDVWTKKDPLKRETAKKNNLNWLEFFTLEEFKAWYYDILRNEDCDFKHTLLDKNVNLIFNKADVKEGMRNVCIWPWDDVSKVVDLFRDRTPLYARNLVIGEVSQDECKVFLDKYHLQNSCNGQNIRLGLYLGTELVEIMTFGEPRYNRNYQYELLRLCSKTEYNVIGGAERLYKHFLKTYKPNSIISYCDNSKFDGDVYKRLGMKLVDKGKPSKHWYNIVTDRHITDNLLRMRGYSQLHNDTEHKKGEDNELLMYMHGYLEVFDCGQSTYTWIKCK